jgi:hypothetical protein
MTKGLMKPCLRISIKDYARNKNLKVLLFEPPFPSRGYLVRMAGKPWPPGASTASLSRVLVALRKALVKATRAKGPTATLQSEGPGIS